METGFPIGLLLGCLHWWQFEKFCLGLTGSPGKSKIVLFSSGRWGLTALVGILYVQLNPGSALPLVAGFLLAMVVARATLLRRYRAKP